MKTSGSGRPGPIDVAATRLRPQKRALDDVLSARDPARLAPATIPPLQSSCTYAREFACRIFRGDRSRITGRHNASAQGMLRIDGYRLVSGMRLNALDWLNFFLADVRGGLGAYVNVFLLTRAQ
jgi:hypothetical protein